MRAGFLKRMFGGLVGAGAGAKSGSGARRQSPSASSRAASGASASSPARANEAADEGPKSAKSAKSATSGAAANARRRPRRSGAKSRARKLPGYRKAGLLPSFASLSLSLGTLGAIVVAGTMSYFIKGMPGLDEVTIPKRAPAITIMSSTGEIMGRRGTIHAGRIGVEELPKHMIEAVLAIEDRRFYEHIGVDVIGLARAFWENYKAGRDIQGGSTLTQQLAKNLFLTPERTYRRKIQEAVLAIRLESVFSKNEIIEIYLNRVYFGAGTYGIEAASERYFEKSARDLTIGESAILAGLLKAPSRYAPTASKDRAIQRATVVLDAMQDAGFLNEQERFVALQGLKTPRAKRKDEHETAPYVLDWVAESLTEVLGEPRGDLVVETTLDLKLQAVALEAARKTIEAEGEAKKASQAAVVVMDNNGATRALVGGLDYDTSQFNRAVRALRQPGSTFKTFVYLAAMESGYTPFDERYDQPFKIGEWEPHNYSQKYRGLVTLTEALGRSINTVAAQIGDEVGMHRVVDVAKRLGITSPLHANPSLALGTGEVSLFELTGAFAPLANGGTGVTPHVIRRVYSGDGQVLYERHGSQTVPVLSHEQVAAMNYMLTGVTSWGTGTRSRIEGHHTAGKTGTTQDYRDAWFIGYSGHYTAGVWIGNDDNSPMNRVTGGSMPAAIWKEVMSYAHEGLAPIDLPIDVTPPLAPVASEDRYVSSSRTGGWFGSLFGFGRRAAPVQRRVAPVEVAARSPFEGPPRTSGYSAPAAVPRSAYGGRVDAYGRALDDYGRPIDGYGRVETDPRDARRDPRDEPRRRGLFGWTTGSRSAPAANQRRERPKSRVFNGRKERREYEARRRREGLR